MTEIVLLLHNIRSTHNVGSIMRTAEGFGVKEIIFSGYTPHPRQENDPRLPHIITKLEKQLHKTALGAEKIVKNNYLPDPTDILMKLKADNYQIISLEQAKSSQNLKNFTPSAKIVLILGEEVAGISANLLNLSDVILEIPMVGQKESFNVSVAAGIALYQLS